MGSHHSGRTATFSSVPDRLVLPLSFNIASNVMQLMSRGVPLRMINSGFRSKLVEINQYLKNLDRVIEVKTEMARWRGDNLKTIKLSAELKALEDANRRLSIWPLIEAGEFSTIADGQVEADAAIQDGKWTVWMQSQMEAVPKSLGTLGGSERS